MPLVNLSDDLRVNNLMLLWIDRIERYVGVYANIIKLPHEISFHYYTNDRDITVKINIEGFAKICQNSHTTQCQFFHHLITDKFMLIYDPSVMREPTDHTRQLLISGKYLNPCAGKEQACGT